MPIMPHPVALITHSNYDIPALMDAIKHIISLSGFDLKAVSGKKVLLKPNMLGAYLPEMGVTTHPNFVAAVAKIFKEANAEVYIGDSPNGVYPIDVTWERTGMREAAKMAGAHEVFFESSGSVEINGIKISRAVVDADFVINLPKFKTHGLTILTLAVKNLFGCVNGMQKTSFHRDAKNRNEFATTVVKIAEAVGPALTIIDGIVGMDANGPSAGNLNILNLIVAGRDIHAIDAVCSNLVGLPPQNLDTLAAAKEVGLWSEEDPITLVGDKVEKLEFELPSTYTKGLRDWWVTRFVISKIWNNLSSQPKIDHNLCKKCFLCVDACPTQAILKYREDRPPRIIEKKCIQCFCCHEVCPYRAIFLRESWLIRLQRWLNERRVKAHAFLD